MELSPLTPLKQSGDVLFLMLGAVMVFAMHAGFAFLFFLIIVILHIVNKQAIIDLVYLLAAYTYGPLLGLFFFGLLTKYQVKDKFIPFVAVASPLICYVLDTVGKDKLGFGFGFTILIVNGLLTFFGMYLLRVKR